MTEKPWIIRPVHEAIFRHHAGLDVYKVLVFRSPDIPGSWLANDNCDALATVALENDVPFARFLLHRGANARNAHVIGIPILIVLTRMETRNIRKVEQLPEPMLQQTGWVKATEEEKLSEKIAFDEKSLWSCSSRSDPFKEDRWEQEVLQSCVDGDVPLLKKLSEHYDDNHDDCIGRAMVAAIEHKHLDILTYLIALYPDVESLEEILKPVHDAVFTSKAGLEFWKVLHEAYPVINNWDLNEGTDHLGAVAITGQMAFAEYLIYHGCDARWAQYDHVPILKHMLGNNPVLTKEDRKYIRLRDNRWKWPWFKPMGMRFLRPCDPGEKDWTLMVALLREHGACEDERLSKPRSWLGRTWQASRVGNIDRLERLLDEKDSAGEVIEESAISTIMAGASRHHQAATLAYLIERFPSFPGSHHSWSMIHDEVFRSGKGGMETYKILLKRNPDFVNWEWGHMGDHLTQAAMSDDIEFARFLLENEYHGDASRALFSGRSVLELIDGPKRISKEVAKGSPWLTEHRRQQKAGIISKRRRPVEMIRLLENHGAVNTRRKKTLWEKLWE
ncbi:Hypothetical protein D9617_2g056110 [Elsinoe fawcettii]|nr:Hypothetical protein D9617_2g056110 [Elsinoe fawcettii]